MILRMSIVMTDKPVWVEYLITEDDLRLSIDELSERFAKPMLAGLLLEWNRLETKPRTP